MLPSCRGEAVCRHAACPDHLPCHNHARPSTDSPGCPFSAQGSGLVCFTTTGVQPILCVLCKITRMYLFSIQETERCLNRCGNHLRCQKGIVGYLSVCLSLSVLMCVCVCVCVSLRLCVCVCVYVCGCVAMCLFLLLWLMWLLATVLKLQRSRPIELLSLQQYLLVRLICQLLECLTTFVLVISRTVVCLVALGQEPIMQCCMLVLG